MNNNRPEIDNNYYCYWCENDLAGNNGVGDVDNVEDDNGNVFCNEDCYQGWSKCQPRAEKFEKESKQ